MSPLDRMNAIRDSKIFGPAKAVAWALGTRADRDGLARPSIATLARDAGVRSENTARAGLRELVRLGVVRVTKRFGASHLIKFDDRVLAGLRHPTPSPVEPPSPVAPLHIVTPTSSRDDETPSAAEAEGDQKETIEGDLPRTRARAGSRRKRTPSAKPNHPEHASVVAHWFQEFERAKSVAPTFAAREGKLVTQLLERLKAGAEAKAVISRAFADPWWVKNQCNLGSLVANPDRYRGRTNGASRLQPTPADLDPNKAWMPAEAT